MMLALQTPLRLPASHARPCNHVAAKPKGRVAARRVLPPLPPLPPPLRPGVLACRASNTSGETFPAYLARVHEAAECGDLPGLQAALADLQHPETDIDALLPWGGGVAQAPIHRAAAAGRETCLRVLLVNGADRDALDGAGRTPMLLAAAEGNQDCVEVLLSGGVAMTADPEGQTPLHAAACSGHVLCAQQLINSRRIPTDATDSSGRTALHLAAAAPQGSVPTVRALLAAGASASAVNSSGATPRQVAATAGNTATELYLLAVESTARAFPGRPTRSDLLSPSSQGEDGDLAVDLAVVYRLARQLEAGSTGVSQADAKALRAAVRQLVGQQGQAPHFFEKAEQ